MDLSGQNIVAIEAGSNLSFYSGNDFNKVMIENIQYESSTLTIPGLTIGISNNYYILESLSIYSSVGYNLYGYQVKVVNSPIELTASVLEHYLSLGFGLGYDVLNTDIFKIQLYTQYSSFIIIGKNMTINSSPINVFNATHNSLDQNIRGGLKFIFDTTIGSYFLNCNYTHKLNHNVSTTDGNNFDITYRTFNFLIGFQYNLSK